MCYTFTVPLKDLLRDRDSSRRTKRASQPKEKAQPALEPPVGRSARRRMFLAELEATGEVAIAASRAGCSSPEIRRWRQTDPKFSRDYALAVAAYLQSLRAMVVQLATELGHLDERRQRATGVLASEAAYRDGEGRLDARAWASALRGSLADLRAAGDAAAASAA